MEIGTHIDEIGRLVREEGAFVLRRDAGGLWRLELNRTPVDEVEKRVRVIGSYAGDGVIDVDGIALA